MAQHLAVSLRVVASHLHMRHVAIEIAQDEVQQAAQQMKAGTATPEIERLVARLEKATGCSVAELAKLAGAWA